MPSVPTSGSVPPPPPVWDAQPPQATVRYAGFWIRVLAAFIDGIALTILWRIIAFVLPPTPPLPMPEEPDFQAMFAYMDSLLPADAVVTYAALTLAYFVLQESSSAQATIGKRLLSIRVSTADDGRLSLVTAALRAWPIYLPTVAALAGIGVSWLVSLLALIACVAVAFSARKQGLHDKMAGAILTRR